jgi:predicted metalloprotease with PDZ domain
MKHGTRLSSLVLLALGCASPTVADLRTQDATVTYRVSLPAPQTQRVEIAVTLPTNGEEYVDLMLPVWRPGRYSVLDPVGTLRSFEATSGAGEVLPTTRTDKSTWRIETGGADTLRANYSVYANSLYDRTRHVDSTHAFLSGSSVFMYTPRLRNAPVRVEVDAPAGWQIAGGLENAPGEEFVLVADNYDVLVDSPLEIGLHDRHVWEIDGVPHEIVIWPQGLEYDVERMQTDFGKIVQAQAAIFGRMPYERYVFLIHASRGGGGTEHLNSTIMQVSRATVEGSLENDSSYKRMHGLVGHEMFHTWNVKQLRPAGIHPYDYQKENYTDLLWVSEGMTSYYGDLTLVRASLKNEKKYIDGLASSIESMRRRPGTRVQSPAESSFDAWTKADSSSADDYNTEVSFYSQGLMASLLLDMELRGRTENRVCLDDVLKTLFERYPLSGTGFTTADMIEVCDELSASSFGEFFASYVAGTDDYPLEETLLAVGLELSFQPTPDKKEEEEDEDEEEDEGGEAEETEEPVAAEASAREPELKAYLGLRLSSGGSGSRVTLALSDGPAYDAGLIPGDEIIALNGRRLRSSDLDKKLEKLAPGDDVLLHVMRNDELIELRITLDGILDGKWKIKRVLEPSELQKEAYASWLGQPWPEKKKPEEAEGDIDQDDAD